jgi:hypothetical protein
MCVWIGSQWSHGVVTAMVLNSLQSIHHQRRYLYQSIYLDLSKDWGFKLSSIKLPYEQCDTICLLNHHVFN